MATLPSRSFALTEAIIFTGDVFVEGHALLVEDGHILDIIAGSKVPANLPALACPEHILTPGFVDCQVNGGGNVLFNASPDVESLQTIVEAHRKTGTTRLLPTVVSDTPDITRQAVEASREARKKEKSILGIHIEGPHISSQNKGIHTSEHIRPLHETDVELYTPHEGEIMLLTLAPESVTAGQIHELRKRGVIVSLGHTAATGSDVRGALEAGATGFTHLFNAMGPITAREPGAAGIALDDPYSWCSLIADGRHVAPELIRLALKAKPYGRLFFISDAMPPAGADKPEAFSLGKEKIYPKNNVCQNEEGKLAGAMMTLGEIVAYTIRELKLAPELAFQMAATIPAAFLGLGEKYGRLIPGCKADIVALDHFFKAQYVWREGEAC